MKKQNKEDKTKKGKQTVLTDALWNRISEEILHSSLDCNFYR